MDKSMLYNDYNPHRAYRKGYRRGVSGNGVRGESTSEKIEHATKIKTMLEIDIAAVKLAVKSDGWNGFEFIGRMGTSQCMIGYAKGIGEFIKRMRGY